MKGIINNTNELWNIVRNYTSNDDGTIPTNIILEGKQVSSPKQLADVFNDHFIDKVNKIRRGFRNDSEDPIEILEKLVKKPESKFTIPEITLKETYNIITNMKSSNSSGFDEITSKTIKMIPHVT